MTIQYCPRGHSLFWLEYDARVNQIERPGARRDARISCDACRGPIRYPQNTHFCRSCDADICDQCFDSKPHMYQWKSSDFQSEVIEACCLMAIAMTEDPVTAGARGERYNGCRPTLGRRVSYDAYPDPTNYGWTFTGSCNGGRAEFFEKDFSHHGVVKLDFYYTTGTVKTVLDHPRQGVTQLFAKGSDLSPEIYRRILLNPREHTSVRYHTSKRRR